MQKSSSYDIHVFSASKQAIIDDAFITEMHTKANKLRAKAFAQFVNLIAKGAIALFASFSKWLYSKAQTTRAKNQLYSMDDRALADIGLTRGDIESVLNGTWTRETHQPIAKNFQLIKKTNVGKNVDVQDDTRIAA